MEIVETSIFTKQIQGTMSDDEYHLLQIHLVNRPDAGRIIRGSGGLRKIRWGSEGRGTRGGMRIIYYWCVYEEIILMLFVYPKNELDNLSKNQLKQLRQIVEREYK